MMAEWHISWREIEEWSNRQFYLMHEMLVQRKEREARAMKRGRGRGREFEEPRGGKSRFARFMDGILGRNG